jgi:hypothetical protein
MNSGRRERGGRFWLGHQRCKAWPLATACGGKGLTMLVAQHVATVRSKAEFGLGKSCAKIIRVGIYLRILAGIDTRAQCFQTDAGED